MQIHSREAAKFLFGIAYHAALGHRWLGIWSKYLLPGKFSRFTFTSTMNTVAMVVWPIVLTTLV
jgi:hypothetical protein